MWWSPPRPGWTKINTDGSAVGSPGITSCRGVFRMYMNFVHSCFDLSLTILHVFEAELAGLIKALELAQSNHWFLLWIEADSIYLVEVVRKCSRDVPWRFRAAWMRSLEFLESVLFQISHVHREGNQLVDCLTSHGSSLDSFIVWHPGFLYFIY